MKRHSTAVRLDPASYDLGPRVKVLGDPERVAFIDAAACSPHNLADTDVKADWFDYVDPSSDEAVAAVKLCRACPVLDQCQTQTLGAYSNFYDGVMAGQVWINGHVVTKPSRKNTVPKPRAS